MKYDAIVIGGGVNGLVTAAYLGKAGKRAVVLERRSTLGGITATEQFHPGYRANMCVDDAGWVPASVVADLGLAQRGYAPTHAATGLVVPLDGAAPLVLPTDVSRASDAIRRLSVADAAAWPGFCALIARLAGFLEALYTVRPPDVHTNSAADLLTMLSLGKRLRGLGKRGIVDLLRTVPMPIADLLDEWFEHPGLKAALSLHGVLNVQHGPMSGGTALVFLHRHIGLPLGHIGGRRVTPGGVGSLASALAAAAQAAGVEVRTNADVAEIVVENDAVSGVRLTDGSLVAGTLVASAVDPRRTFGTLVDPGFFDPEMLTAVDNIRMRGPAARVHLALTGRPAFSNSGHTWGEDAVRGSLALVTSMKGIEKAYDAAKHGGVSEHPAILVTLPSVDDPTFAQSGHHVLTAHVQYAAFKAKGGWTTAVRDALGDTVVQTIAEVAPTLPQLIRHRVVLAPPDLAEQYGVTEGSLMHGELALDQFLFMRPVPECARYRTPVAGLWLCGGGSHPGAGTAGATGMLAAKEILASKS